MWDGFGIKKVQVINATLLAKLGWQIITDPDNWLFKVVSAKYLTTENFLEAKKLLMLQQYRNISWMIDI